MSSAFPALSLADIQKQLCASGQPFEMETVSIGGVPTRTWQHSPKTIQTVVEGSKGHGDRLATIYEDERISFSAQYRAICALAHWLLERGIQRGDRVAIAMRNLPEWPVAFFAVTSVGAIAVPLNSWGTTSELAHGLRDSGAAILIADAERAARIENERHGLPTLRHVLVTRGASKSDSAFEAVIGPSAGWGYLAPIGLPPVAIDSDDDATIFYTSGTTGQPKGAVGSHRNMTSIVMAAAYVGTRAAMRRGDPPPLPRHRIALIAVPLFHVTGCAAGLMTATAAGNTNIYMRRWDALEAMRLIERERVTSTGGVPTIAWQILDHPDRHQFDLSSLEGLGYGGAPSAPALVERIAAAGLAPSNGWGMTETTATVSSNIAEDYIARPDSCGPALPVSDFRITRKDGSICRANEVGELWARGPQIVRGYWNNAPATAATFIDGWLRTGDLAKLDADGFCYIVDRIKDVVIRGGENIYAAEVENALFEHPDIDDAALIGLPHPTLGEQPAAVVHLTFGSLMDAESICAWVGLRLAAFKVPTRIAFSQERLPRNAAGKVLKRELASTFFGNAT